MRRLCRLTDGPSPAWRARDTPRLQAIADGVVRLADCLYLALAEREGAAIATADARLAALAARRRLVVLRVPSA